MLFTFQYYRWYDATKTCMSIEQSEPVFEKLVRYINDSVDIPAFDDEVLDIINDKAHYTKNRLWLQFLKPVTDAVASLERNDAHVGTVLIEFIILYRKIKDFKTTNVDRNLRNMAEDAKSYVLQVLDKRFAVIYNCKIFVLGLFLTPAWRNVVTSSVQFPLKDYIIRGLGVFAQSRGMLTKSFGTELVAQIDQYAHNKAPFVHAFVSGQSTIEFWKACREQRGMMELSTIALLIFELVPQAAPIETVFSMMGNIKSVKKNRMTVCMRHNSSYDNWHAGHAGHAECAGHASK